MRHARGLVEFAVRVLIAVFLVRAFVVEVCSVPTGSMAPAMLGLHYRHTCVDCGLTFDFDATMFDWADRPVCPNCGFVATGSAAEVAITGDRVLIDKASFRLRSPQRWEPIVFRSPEAASVLFVKRVIGLPGESVQVRNGDVYIDGQIARKSLDEQRALAILVHDADHMPRSDLPPRWQPVGDTVAWEMADARFHYRPDITAPPPAPWIVQSRPKVEGLPQGFSWLAYSHWRRTQQGVAPAGVTDLGGYDQSTPRLDEEVSPVVDLLLSCQVRCEGGGTLAVWATNGADKFLLLIFLPSGQVELSHNGRARRLGKLPPETFASDCELELSLVDRQVVLAINRHSILAPYPFDSPVLASAPVTLFAIGASGLEVELSRLRIYRDVYYTQPLGLRQTWGLATPYRLSADEFFVLGDNSPISEDSRLWIEGPGVNRNLLVGKPFMAIGNQPVDRLWGGRFQIPALDRIRYIH